MVINKSSSIVVFIFVLITNIYGENISILESLQNDMKQFNAIATKIKQNEDYQPYNITTFHGNELEKIGIMNLKEALLLVPGVDMATDNFNNQVPIFRGSNHTSYGESKLLINGFLVNNLFFDSYSEYLSLPIEMIKRIEVVRGPGSKIDGVNAYAGSINVITYSESLDGFTSKNRLIAKYGSYDYKMLAFMKSFEVGKFKGFVDFYYQKDNKKLYAGPDGLAQGIFGPANVHLSQDSKAPLWVEDLGIGLHLKYENISFETRILEHTQGSAYGINLSLPLDKDRAKLPSYYAQLAYKNKYNDYEIDLKLAVKYDKFNSRSKLAPDNLLIGGIVFNDGVQSYHSAEQLTLSQSLYVKYTGMDQHTISIGYQFRNEETIKTKTFLSNRLTGDVALVDYTQTQAFFDENAKRNKMIISFEDTYLYNDYVSILYGANVENNSFENNIVNPRISFVYQVDAKNIFKFMYSKSHRNPSWQEMYTKNNLARVGSTTLSPEVVDALEFAYIKRFTHESYISSNIFYLKNKNQIFNTATNPEFKNMLNANIYGLEIEYKQSVFENGEIYINYSYVDGYSYTTNSHDKFDLSNIAKNKFKGYYKHKLSPDLTLSSIVKYIGKKKRTQEDTREALSAYLNIDASIYYENKKDDYTLTLSAKNIFNEEIKYPSKFNTYVLDYLQEERNFLLTFTKNF